MTQDLKASQLQPAPTLRVQQNQVEALAETIAVEAPFELRINGRSHTILMITPHEVRQLALGFCLSEGLVTAREQVLDISLGQGELPGLGPAYWAQVTLPDELARRARVKRVAPAATSCGLCGLESLDQVRVAVEPLPLQGLTVELEVIFSLLEAMERRQPIHAATGGTHAVGLADASGRVVAVCEDVGRHNALDKALGSALEAGEDLTRLVALLSGRISYEMALKLARCRVPVAASVSAATSLGLGLARRLGVTLLGFTRQKRTTAFTHSQRVLVKGRPLPPLPEPE